MQNHPTSSPENALPLQEAMHRFVSKDLWRAFENAKDERKKLPRRPTFFSSSIRGWEAERANRPAKQAISAETHVDRAWAAIKRALIEQLVVGDLTAYAQSDPPFGGWQAIPASAWRSLRIKNVRHGRVVRPNVDLSGVHIVETPGDDGAIVRTGYSGRPDKSRDIIEAEFARRVEAGELEPSMVRQSLVLESWFKTNHRGKPQPKAKTIENNLREAYREAASRIVQNPPK